MLRVIVKCCHYSRWIKLCRLLTGITALTAVILFIMGDDVISSLPHRLTDLSNFDFKNQTNFSTKTVSNESSWNGNPKKEVTMTISQLKLRYKLRNERLNEVCRRIATHPPVFFTHKNVSKAANWTDSDDEMEETPNTAHFSLLPPIFRTMGCFVNKVASSSLVTAFLQARGLGPSFKSPHASISRLHPKSMAMFLKANATYFKFMFVRHPMRRALSSYVDKMIVSPKVKLNQFRAHVHVKGREIIRKRQSEASQNDSSSETEKDPDNNKEEVTTAKVLVPTFEEFLEFILETDLQGHGFASHWVPYHRYCSPCSIRYDVIGKLETEEDFKYVWDRSGLTKAKIDIPWLNNKTRPTSPSIHQTEMENRYYSSVPRELILRFYDKFRLDFHLFGYSINEILVKAGYQTIEEEQL